MKHTLLALTIASSLLLAPSAFAASVDVNSADAETIADALTGIGIKTAMLIVDYRDQNGPFASAGDLLAVKGIGEKTLEKIETDVLFD